MGITVSENKVIKNLQKCKKPEETKREEDVQFSQLTFKENFKLTEIIPKKKNYSKLFIEAEKKQRKLKSLEGSHPSEAEQVIETEQWDRAMNRVEGKKQKDDVKRLHKSWKQVQKRKKESKEKLSERLLLIKRNKLEKNRIKSEDAIKERKESKLSSKLKREDTTLADGILENELFKQMIFSQLGNLVREFWCTCQGISSQN